MPARLTFEEVKAVALARGGECLSDAYQGTKVRLLWRCQHDHEWWSTPKNVRKGTWCHVCSHRIPLTIEDAKAKAHKRGGECLSESMATANETLLRWRCAAGHEWSGTLASVRTRWCPHCAGKRRTIEQMQEWAGYRGGRCLSSKYEPQSKLTWQCAGGHVWKQTPALILGGIWCPQCVGRGKTILDMQALAESKGGKCLSDVYVNTHAHLTWQCAKGHTWRASHLNVRSTSWCPYCKQNKREKLCRAAFELVYGAAFPKARPSWLRNSRGNQMELDGYSTELQIAFEYQGFQHSQLTMWHGSEDEFKWQQQRDREKCELCAVNGVQLIEVPWTTKDLVSFVSQAAQRVAA